MATMIEVAKRAGVSIATVSGVLNGSRYVSPKLAERVMKAAMDLDYTTNQIARSLQSRSAQIVAMLVPDISDPFHANVVRVVEDALKTAGYTLLLRNLRDRPANTFKADFVAIGHRTGSSMAIEHLVSRGRKRIAIIPGPSGQSFSEARIEGWRDALRTARVPRSGALEVMSSHDSAVLDVFDPPISSVDQPAQDIGLTATELLLSRIRQPDRPVQRVLLRPRLKIQSAGVMHFQLAGTQ